MDKDFEATGRAEGAFWGLPSSFKGVHTAFHRCRCGWLTA